MELKHFSHEHPLMFIQKQIHAPTADSSSGEEEEEAAYCCLCEDRVEGPSYCCTDCRFYLHKTCAEFELALEINHPFHPKHPFILLPKPPHRVGIFLCWFCHMGRRGFGYHCALCNFNLDVNCALFQLSMVGNFPTLVNVLSTSIH
ncbi:uncharacterized protein LOC110414791 [Herrania umbratica]|uniref:Uncharacterized protein LOC110414791 n=1 Tax=Herrania umbratica TaxID=108875 RepID=A0A6J1A4V1_9ROSI|nr:uncharacterized protein LOC110414791 [Herrania umbratica]